MEIGDRVINISNEVGTIVCISEGIKGSLWYSVRYDVDPNRVFLNAEKSIRYVDPNVHTFNKLWRGIRTSNLVKDEPPMEKL